jgi:hypothetical protein
LDIREIGSKIKTEKKMCNEFQNLYELPNVLRYKLKENEMGEECRR